MYTNVAAMTAQEACAREIECMARGHVAHEAVCLLKLVKTIRALPASDSVAEAILAATRAALKQKEAETGHYRVLMDWAVERLIQVPDEDPMEPYSDREKWWPRVAAVA